MARSYGTAGMKKITYWQEGYSNTYWRNTKTVSSLRNRYRFYVKYLTLENIEEIRRLVKTGVTHYINFASTDDGKK